MPTRSLRASVTLTLIIVMMLGLSFTFVSFTAESLVRAEVGPEHHAGNHRDVIDSFYDHAGRWVPLRRGWYDPAYPKSGYGYEKIATKQSWTSSDRCGTERARKDPDRVEQQKMTGHRTCISDAITTKRTQTWYTRKVLVQFASNTKGIVTSCKEWGYQC